MWYRHPYDSPDGSIIQSKGGVSTWTWWWVGVVRLGVLWLLLRRLSHVLWWASVVMVVVGL